MILPESTMPQVFIIESLSDYDIQRNQMIGKIIFSILRMSGMRPVYRYVKTANEMQRALGVFSKLHYRYLHLSCHGSEDSFGFHYGDVPFNQFQLLLRDRLQGKRVFISACKVVTHHNHELANLLLRETGCQSLVGSFEDIFFCDAALIWSTFYYLCFEDQQDPIKMRRKDIVYNLKNLTGLFQINLNYYFLDEDQSIRLTQFIKGKKRGK
jgi:hypothetical protein